MLVARAEGAPQQRRQAAPGCGSREGCPALSFFCHSQAAMGLPCPPPCSRVQQPAQLALPSWLPPGALGFQAKQHWAQQPLKALQACWWGLSGACFKCATAERPEGAGRATGFHGSKATRGLREGMAKLCIKTWQLELCRQKVLAAWAGTALPASARKAHANS